MSAPGTPDQHSSKFGDLKLRRPVIAKVSKPLGPLRRRDVLVTGANVVSARPLEGVTGATTAGDLGMGPMGLGSALAFKEQKA